MKVKYLLFKSIICMFFSLQNTNGVNFYNILTQQPDEKTASFAGGNFICMEPWLYLESLNKWSYKEGTRIYSSDWCVFFLFCASALQAHRHIRPLHKQSLSELMNGPIRKKLGIIPQNVTWGGTLERDRVSLSPTDSSDPSFLQYFAFFVFSLSLCAGFRASRGGFQQHGGGFYEASGGYSGPAVGSWSQCHSLQRPAGSYSGHSW